jgi:hypothetical protein
MGCADYEKPKRLQAFAGGDRRDLTLPPSR